MVLNGLGVDHLKDHLLLNSAKNVCWQDFKGNIANATRATAALLGADQSALIDVVAFGNGTGGSQRTWYQCGNPGHMAKDGCQRENTGGRPQASASEGGPRRDKGTDKSKGRDKNGSKGKVKCPNCGGLGDTNGLLPSRSLHSVDEGESYEEDEHTKLPRMRRSSCGVESMLRLARSRFEAAMCAEEDVEHCVSRAESSRGFASCGGREEEEGVQRTCRYGHEQ